MSDEHKSQIQHEPAPMIAGNFIFEDVIGGEGAVIGLSAIGPFCRKAARLLTTRLRT